METNAIQRRNADEQSDSNELPGMTTYIVCSQYKPLSDYSLYVRRWDGAYVAKANICAECITNESAAWRYNHVADQKREDDR